jgi:hypothetical protein
MDNPDVDSTMNDLQKAFERVQTNDPEFAPVFREFLQKYKDHKSIDKQLLERLAVLSNAHKITLFKDGEYNKLLGSIDDNSIIVYFKAARSFEVYKASQITDLQNYLGRDYRGINDMYEIIPDHLPQKIFIICEPDIIPHMDTIQNYVIEFMKTKDVDIQKSEIKAFKSLAGMVEIVINGYYVLNHKESDAFLRELIEFIEAKEKNLELTRNMNGRYYINHKGAHMVSMPNCRTTLAGKTVEGTELVTVLARNLADCRDINTGNIYLFKNVNMNIVAGNNYGVIGDNNIINKSKTIIINSNNAQEFIDYLKENKPEWYTPKKAMDKNLLHLKYEEICQTKISDHKFHVMFDKKLFNGSRRATSKGQRFQEIIPYDYAEMP